MLVVRLAVPPLCHVLFVFVLVFVVAVKRKKNIVSQSVSLFAPLPPLRQIAMLHAALSDFRLRL